MAPYSCLHAEISIEHKNQTKCSLGVILWPRVVKDVQVWKLI